MAEKSDATARLRRAVKENNLFLVRRLIQRTDMRNPDPSQKRFTSLAWAAVLGHEETFEYLLSAGHDDVELSKDSENNTILMLLADVKPSPPNPYSPVQPHPDIMGAALRMARLYHDRYSWLLDWSNMHGKTALHVASLKGNEELVRMLCDLGADFDLSDNKGNTPLHYASSWGHVPLVQLLIERGCQFSARNNHGFTPSDYAYSFSTMDTLQDTARMQFENNKKTRRIQAQNARGNDWADSENDGLPPPLPSKARDILRSPRMRSGSGTSRTTNTSDSGEVDGTNSHPHHTTSLSPSSSPSQPSVGSSSFFHIPSTFSRSTNIVSAGSSTTFSITPPSLSHASLLGASTNPAYSLSPIANRVRERDADAMQKYMNRNRSGSSETDNKSLNGSSSFSSAGPSANGDDITSLTSPSSGSSTPRRLLRPSVSAAQLRTTAEPHPVVTKSATQTPEPRIRSGTNPGPTRPPALHLTRSSSQSTSSHLLGARAKNGTSTEEKESFTGPPSLYAQFPDPPLSSESTDGNTPTVTRRLPFNLLSKPLLDSSAGHRRGASATSTWWTGNDRHV